MIESERPNKWRFFFSLRRLPPQYADVTRIMRVVDTIIILLIPAFSPGQHYGAYILCSAVIFLGGRAVAFLAHDRIGVESQARVLRPLLTVESNLFIILGVVASIGSLYYAWKDADPEFVMISFLCAAPLCYFLGSRLAKTRIAMGVLDVGLMLLSLILYDRYLLTGFLVTAASAALFAWALLLRRGYSGPGSPFLSNPAKPTQPSQDLE
jgi:hypothetical protein